MELQAAVLRGLAQRRKARKETQAKERAQCPQDSIYDRFVADLPDFLSRGRAHEVPDAQALGQPTDAADALAAWFDTTRLKPYRGDDDHSKLCISVSQHLLTVVVKNSEQFHHDDMGMYFKSGKHCHIDFLQSLGYHTMALHRLCYIANKFFPTVTHVQVVAWCDCDYDHNYDRNEESEDEVHRAGKALVDMQAWGQHGHRDPLVFDEQVRITLYKTNRKKWSSKSKPMFGSVMYGCDTCGACHSAMKLCGPCSRRGIRTTYCSAECQRKDWPHHKQLCKYTTFDSKDDMRRAGLLLLEDDDHSD